MIKNEKLDNLYHQKKLIERKKLELQREELTLLMEFEDITNKVSNNGRKTKILSQKNNGLRIY